jgi:hypothetical protein
MTYKSLAYAPLVFALTIWPAAAGKIIGNADKAKSAECQTSSQSAEDCNPAGTKLEKDQVASKIIGNGEKLDPPDCLADTGKGKDCTPPAATVPPVTMPTSATGTIAEPTQK